jgi:hypothetical protein
MSGCSLPSQPSTSAVSLGSVAVIKGISKPAWGYVRKCLTNPLQRCHHDHPFPFHIPQGESTWRRNLEFTIDVTIQPLQRSPKKKRRNRKPRMPPLAKDRRPLLTRHRSAPKTLVLGLHLAVSIHYFHTCPTNSKESGFPSLRFLHLFIFVRIAKVLFVKHHHGGK